MMLLCRAVADFSRVMPFVCVLMTSFVVLMPTKAFPVPDFLRPAGYPTYEARARHESHGQQEPNEFNIDNDSGVVLRNYLSDFYDSPPTEAQLRHSSLLTPAELSLASALIGADKRGSLSASQLAKLLQELKPKSSADEDGVKLDSLRFGRRR